MYVCMYVCMYTYGYMIAGNSSANEDANNRMVKPNVLFSRGPLYVCMCMYYVCLYM